MTAPDPRLGEIEGRLGAATPGPWDFAGNEIDNIPDYASANPVPWAQVMECEVSCMSYCYGGSINMTISEGNREFISHSPADVAYLLAELRKRDDALAKVEGVAADLAERGGAIDAKGHNGSINGYRHEGRGVGYQEGSRLIRAAVTAAMGDEDA